MKHLLLILLGIILILGVGIYLLNLVSPWPGTLLIRAYFEKGATKTSHALEKQVPKNITEIPNLQYRPNDKDAYLDVFYPNNTSKPLPTIVWVHGGGWVSGNKDQVENYLKILSSNGYTTVSVNYSIAPEHQYPLPVIQVNDALGYLNQNSEKLNIEANQFILAGDSAGAQIAAQVATLTTNPDYANSLTITPKLTSNKIVATILNCGAYNLGLIDLNGKFGEFLKTVLWAYSGSKDFLNNPFFQTSSVENYVSKDFPATYITAGNADPLEPQSISFANKLKSLGVKVNALFYAKDHQPQLGHEYQFDLNTPDGQKSLDATLDFLGVELNR